MAQSPISGRTAEPGVPDQRGSRRIADYLRRYPEISDLERSDLVDIFRQLSNLDIAFILSDPEVAPKFERFRAEHRRETRLPFRDYGALLLLAALTLILIVYEVAIMS